MAFEQEGKVVQVGDIEERGSFRKRALVLDITKDAKYPNFAGFEFTQAACDKLDKVSEGDIVKVSFDISGRAWNDKYFTNLRAWRLDVVQSADPGGPRPGAYAEVEVPF